MNLLDKIITYEWDMLQAVRSLRVYDECKRDKRLFFEARRSQWSTLPVEIQISYLQDIHQALQTGRNLVTEKYARMMTAAKQQRYLAMEALLPSVSADKAALVEGIVYINCLWQQQAITQYPSLREAGRPAETDRPGQVSFSTYLRGELLTYSEQTLRLLLCYTLEQYAAGRNLVIDNIRNRIRIEPEKGSAP